MSRLIRFVYSRLAPGLLVLALAGCVPGGANVPATPTIMRLPAETRAAVETEQAQRRFAQSSPSVPTSTATAEPASVLTAEPSPTARVAAIEAESTPTATQVPSESAPTPAPEATASPDVAKTTPTPGAVEHVVRSGESLSTIARDYGVTIRAIAEANGITDPSTIYAGQTLVIPTSLAGTPAAQGASATETPTATPRPAAQEQTDVAEGRIAFQMASGGEIWAVNADGSGLERLTTGLDPAWSPDGRRLAFVRWEEPRGLYVLETATGEERLLRGLNLIKSPTWAPEGDRLAFAWETSGAEPTRLCFPGFGCFELPGRVVWSLTVVDIGGNILADPAADQRSFSPSWSPSGDWIAYQGENGLKATTPDGQPWVVLDDVAAVFPEVAPNGQQLVFMYRQHDHWEVYTSLFDGTGIRALTQSSPLEEQPAQNVAPTWSPDGSQILFLTDRDGRWRPYIMQANGSDQRPFLPEVFDQFTFRYDFAAERVFSWR